MKRYYVLFGEMAAEHEWWHIFIKKGWRHCLILEDIDWAPASLLPTAQTLSTEYSQGELHTNIVAGPPMLLVDQIGLTGNLILAIEIYVEKSKRIGYIPISMYTCVTYVKSKLGLKCSLVLTPYQLHRRLLAEGGCIVWEVQ